MVVLATAESQRVLIAQEMEELASRMDTSRSKVEKRLAGVLLQQVLPSARESAAGRRRAAERDMALEAAPKKRSSRLQVRHQLSPSIRHHPRAPAL